MAIKLSTTQRQKSLSLFLSCWCAISVAFACVRTWDVRHFFSPDASPWRKLYNEGDKSSFLHITGLMWDAFDALLHIVIPPGRYIRRRWRGRPWSLPPDGMLGLLLCFWEAKYQINGFVWSLELLHLRACASWEGCYEWQWSGCVPTPLHKWSSQMRQGCGYIRIWSVLENQRWRTFLDL